MRSSASDLQRFVDAQEGVYSVALSEIRAGRKRSHWMWFIFPQVEGLGASSTSRFYAIRNRAEAAAYLAHPVLGARLREISAALLEPQGKSAEQIFGSPDWMKLKSSLTLFAEVSGENDPVFREVLGRYFAGERDEQTLAILAQADRAKR